jgi:uncharacterized metal-binding protein YceD (DUF177 family)
MDDRFKIYIEQLRDGHIEKIAEKIPCGFLDVQEKDLSFFGDVIVEGEAYLVENTLVLHLGAQAVCLIPCTICNEPVKTPVLIEKFYANIPFDEIKGGLFNFKDVLREAILLEVPLFAECNDGHCPQRKELDKYLKPESKETKKSPEADGFKPFADFNWE